MYIVPEIPSFSSFPLLRKLRNELTFCHLNLLVKELLQGVHGRRIRLHNVQIGVILEKKQGRDFLLLRTCIRIVDLSCKAYIEFNFY